MKCWLMGLVLSSGYCGLAAAQGSIVNGPNMGDCIRRDANNSIDSDDQNSPSAFLSGKTFIVDFDGTALRNVSTTGNDNERMVTVKCKGNVRLSFPQRFQLDQIVLHVDSVNFDENIGNDDFFRVIVRGNMVSEEGRNSFDSRWPNPLRPRNFPGSGPYVFRHRETDTVCGRNLTLQMDQIEALAKRSADNRANSIDISRIHFGFVPCKQ